MRPLALAAIVVTATISPLTAQGSTAELLGQAHEFYERLEVERALPLLRQIVSPNWPFEVTQEQRVEAYKYLGACLTLAGKRDSAVLYFRAAIERDPFTELDPNLFTPAQLATFGEAQRRTFAVAVRPVEPARVDPRTARVTFTIVATHAALVDVKLSAVGAGQPRSLVQSTMDGVREITWDGLLADRRLAPPGRYALAVAGRSRLTGTSDSARVYFDLRHEVAGGGERGGADVVAATAAVTGIVAFLVHRHHGAIPENVAANARRHAERDSANASVRGRNADRIAATVLLVSPAAGEGTGP